MKILLVTGNCPYNHYQERSLQEAGVDARNFGEWGMHLPDHVDAILAENPDIIHLQWPEALTQHQNKDPQTVIDDVRRALPQLKSKGAKLFWTMHNLLPHKRDNTDMWEAVWQLYATHCDVACHHSHCGQDQASTTYDYTDARHIVLHHGYFDQFAHCDLNESEARHKLGLSPHSNIYFGVGALRPDKHIRELIDCFAGRDPERDILVLAGNASWTDYGKEMLVYAEQFPNVIIEEGFIEDDRVAIYANACNAFLYMYGEHHLTSGSPHMSQAFLLPQITLDYAYAREVLQDGASYIAINDQRYEQLHTVLDQLNKECTDEQRRFIKEHREPWNWANIAAQTKSAYEQALNP